MRVFSQRQAPSDIPTFRLRQSTSIVDLLAQTGLARSKSEARRLVQQGGVRLDNQRVNDIHTQVQPPVAVDGIVLRVGRRRFLRLTETRGNETSTEAESTGEKGKIDDAEPNQPSEAKIQH